MTAAISARIWKKRAAAKLCRLRDIQLLLRRDARISQHATETGFSGTNSGVFLHELGFFSAHARMRRSIFCSLSTSCPQELSRGADGRGHFLGRA